MDTKLYKVDVIITLKDNTTDGMTVRLEEPDVWIRAVLKNSHHGFLFFYSATGIKCIASDQIQTISVEYIDE